MKRLGMGALLALVLAAPLAAQEKDFFFQPKERIVFLGDSITEQYQYSSYLELYLTTRFPKGDMTFINAGIGGDSAGGGAGRFQKHVLDEKPTVVTINFGMNDAGYGKFNPTANKNFVERTQAMLSMAKKAGVRVALLSPNAVDRRVDKRFELYVETQKQFYAPLEGVAKEFGMTFVDQYALTRKAVEAMEKDDPQAKTAKPYYDGFHTSQPGGLLMAHAILVGLHAPALVSDVAIDAGKASTKACKVDKLEASPTAVSFTRLDEALPLPVQKDWLSVLPYMDNLKDLNWYGLKVAGLQSGKYVLSIDKKGVGSFSSDELAKGVNLGNLTTGPIHDQANKVLQAINDKNKVVHQRFRSVVMYSAPDWLAEIAKERQPQELAKRTARINEMQAGVYAAAQPVPHVWELRAAAK